MALIARMLLTNKLGAVALVLTLGINATAWAQLPFFPGAEGYGSTWFGTPTSPDGKWLSNATIYRVTSLADSGPGTLRNAFVENSTNKIIVFDVAGTINLSSDNLDIKNLSNYYIAGQTAPGPVTIYGRNTQVTHSSGKFNTNVVLRYLSFRKGTGADEDSLSFAGGPNNDPNHAFVGRHMMFDHVSASWAEDENMSVANHNTLLTVQNSIISDALGGSHAFGSLVRPRRDAEITFHHNLYANNRSRQPRLGIYNEELLTVDVRNNVVYNWSDRATYAGGSDDDWNDDDIDDTEFVNANYVGNYLIAGPATIANSTKGFIVDNSADITVYQSGNLIDSDNAPGGAPDDNTLNGVDQGWNMFQVTTAGAGDVQGILRQRGTAFSMAPVTTQDATAAYNSIISHAGNSRWGRDVIDQRVISNVTGFTSPSNGVAATSPIASELAYVTGGTTPINHPGDWDLDADAMQDAWEQEHGGDLVWNADFDNDGYINLLEYINERGEFPATAPIDYVGPASGTGARYALIQNWRTNDGGITAGSNWQPSKFDVARISNGTILVDAVGQHAGTLQLAPDAGNDATLDVTSGWIKVAGELEVGQGGTGALAVASGAKVYADIVEVGSAGSVRGNGEIIGDVYNNGLITPGDSVGALTVTGDFMQDTGGVLRLEINSAVSYDQFNVTGTFFAGGELDVVLGYSPAAGDSFSLLSFLDAEGGIFFDPPTLNPGLEWNTENLLIDGTLSVEAAEVVEDADFNNDGIVDGRDFLVWQIGFNSVGGLAEGDADGSGFVDADDLVIWENQYGTSGGELAAAAAAVPEPSCFALLFCAVALMSRRGRS